MAKFTPEFLNFLNPTGVNYVSGPVIGVSDNAAALAQTAIAAEVQVKEPFEPLPETIKNFSSDIAASLAAQTGQIETPNVVAAALAQVENKTGVKGSLFVIGVGGLALVLGLRLLRS